MPTYFFNVRHGSLAIDHEGTDLPDDSAAWQQATTACGEMIRDLDGALKAGPEWRMEVLDEKREVIYSLRFQGKSHTEGLN